MRERFVSALHFARRYVDRCIARRQNGDGDGTLLWSTILYHECEWVSCGAQVMQVMQVGYVPKMKVDAFIDI